MFGTKTQRRPTDSEFLNDEGCRTPRATPEWGHLGGSEWERTCSCRREVWRAPDGRLDPNSALAMPSWRAHIHTPGRGQPGRVPWSGVSLGLAPER
jgi:hypothetical protein